MGAKRVWGEHGTYRRYNQGGCADLTGGEPGKGGRCEACISAARDWRARRLAGQTQKNLNGNVTVLDKRRKKGQNTSQNDYTGPKSVPKPNVKRGPVEAGVYEQIKAFEETHPGDVAIALVAARVLDNPERVGVYAPTMRQLDSIIQRLCGNKKTKSGGRLSKVSAMTARAR